MTGGEATEQVASEGGREGAAAGTTARAAWSTVAWLAEQKVRLPDAVAGYVERPPLERRCEGMAQRFTMLLAPGGFGKTALLARCCRRLRERGVAVAWLAVDEEDGAANLGTYLAMAFERAGLAAFDVGRADDGTGSADAPDGEAESHGAYRLNLLIRAVERYGEPCLLAIDELERLRPDAVATLNVLFRRAPRNLHFAVAARERPPGLDIAMYFLEGRGATLTVDDLRFSRIEIATFLGERLPRREFNAVVATTAGWPIALRMVRNAREDGMSATAEGDAVAAWIEARLWRGLSEENRELVLDMALFDWFDGALMDEATGSHDAARRIASMDALTGLLQAAGADAPTMRLHPLVRDYCAARRAREDPERSRRIHAGIARALAHRGQVVDALRHAAMAGDVGLAGEIAENAGGIRLAVRQGFESLDAVVGLLQAEVFARWPRLAVARCLVLAVRGEVERAEQEYRRTAAATSDFTRDRADGDAGALATDHLLLQGMLNGTGCKPDGMKQVALVGEAEDGIGRRDIAPDLRAMFSFGLCMVQSGVGALDDALASAERARTLIDPRSHLAPHITYETGSLAMCRGRLDEAATAYEQGLGMARSMYLRDSGVVVMGEILREELAMERHGAALRRRAGPVSLQLLGESGASFQTFAAALGVGVDSALAHGTADQALVLLEDARTYALRTKRPPLARLVSALRVGAVLADGRVAEAARGWTAGDLPVDAADCLDLGRRGWRVAEAIVCTRIRLCIALRDFGPARELAWGLRDAAASRDLRRTLMRAEALSMALEYAAGEADAALEHLRSFAAWYAESRYAGGLVREAHIGSVLLPRLLETAPSGVLDEVAALLKRATGAGRLASARTLTEGELDVLGCLARRLQDKQIATELHLSVDGVRYRLRRIFRKLAARSRDDAVHRARERGVLPQGDGKSSPA